MKEFKKNCDLATEFIESCWDSNNSDDGLNFDQRIAERMDTLDEDVKKIVINCMGWCDNDSK